VGKTNISWASHSWNPYTWNCNKVSPGCRNCYAETLALRRGQSFIGAPRLHGDNAWKELRRFPPGAVVFVNSMSDTYHEGATAFMIHSLHNAALYTRPDVTFLVLTKRPERALALAPFLAWPPNLWIGTSVESADYLGRLDALLRIPAAGHFVSAEPLLGPLTDLRAYLYPGMVLNRYGIHYRPGLRWVIVGGESGQGRRPFSKLWAQEIQMLAADAGVPFLFKQGSAYAPGQDRLLVGREWNESPFHLAKHEPPAPAPHLVQLTLFD